MKLGIVVPAVFTTTTLAAIMAVTLLTSGGALAATVQPAQAPQCVTSGLPVGVQRVIKNKVVFVRPIANVLNEAIEDFGENGIDDSLQLFCVTNRAKDAFGTIAMCLSNESCPWR